MKTVMVRYKVKPGKAAENEAFIRAVFDQLTREETSGIRYASFKLDDGVSFVHLASVEDSGGANPLSALSAFTAFTANIKDRCEEPPQATQLSEVGSYGLFD